MCIPETAAEARSDGTERVHDGFFMRFGIGAAYVSDHTEEPLSDTSGTFTGGAVATEMAFGGTVGSLVLLGGIFNHIAPSIGGTYETPLGAGTLEASDVSIYSLYALGVDYYVDPTAGWHLGAAMGVGVLALQQGDTTGAPGRGISIRETWAGPGFLIAGGHEWWIGKQWSLGLSARLMAMFTSDPEDRAHTVFIPGILGGVTYH